MRKLVHKILSLLVVVSLPAILWSVSAFGRGNTQGSSNSQQVAQPDTTKVKTSDLAFPFEDKKNYKLPGEQDTSALYLRQPANVTREIIFDAETGNYIIQDKIGDWNYRTPQSMSLKDYRKYDFKQSLQKYWRQQINQQSFEDQKSIVPELQFGGKLFNRIFGSNTISIKPQGFVELSFGAKTNRTDNPSLTERMRKNTTFNFDEKIQMNVTGQIGTKMTMQVNYNTEAAFEFENKMNLGFDGEEDDIVKRIEAGNVSMSIPNSLISGGSNLFGVRADLQFGKLEVSTLFSQQKGETSVVETEGGAQKSKFEFKADQYDANRHFFLSHYFRDQYNAALKNLPIINSGVVINRIEVWVTNKRNNFNEARNIISFQDLAEPQKIFNNVPKFGSIQGKRYPDNEANKLYGEITTNYSGIRSIENINAEMAPLENDNFIQGQDWEKIEQARKLSSSEYTLNEKLGYISLRSALNNDEVLAVAYEYTVFGQVFQIGEFSDGGVSAPNTLILKTLKGTNLSPQFYTWDLMMKNVYNIGANQLSKEDFELHIKYRNDSTGNDITYLPEGPLKGHLLLKVMNLDNLNNQLDPSPNGRFDFIEGITVQSSSGRIIFPVLEPFGSHLADSLGNISKWVDKFAFNSLYDTTLVVARQDAEHNKFKITGSYKGASTSEIPLNTFNVTRGSVKVTAGGRNLTENVDYIVDYMQGKVKIINQALLEAGTPITVSTESEDMFSMQTKTLIGTHLNYNFSDDFNLGATMMYLSEKPLQTKVDYGSEPISNTMVGFNGAYKTESQKLTSLIDALPVIQTKEKSNIAVEGEFAKLFPGHSKYIKGATYIDDFEATKTSIDMRNYMRWFLASTPKDEVLFPESSAINDSLASGYNRALLSWYSIDPLFLRSSTSTPSHIRADKDMQSNHYMRNVFMREIYPFRETTPGLPTYIPTFDLAFYPNERGPYNFDALGSNYSDGTEKDGTLRNPETRWGGIMREVETSNFESANIEYIEFWMLDPFIYDTITPANANEIGGDLYFHLGDISEDILPDSRKSFEHGISPDGNKLEMDKTQWGYVSRKQSMVTAFDNDPAARRNQDVGYDGLNKDEENEIYNHFISQLTDYINPDALIAIKEDPASDDFHYFRGSEYDQQELTILERYKRFNGAEGNSKSSQDSRESYPTAATTLPNIEDINEDNTLNELENYYEYGISLRPADMQLGSNHITGIKSAEVELKNGQIDTVKWYQFKIPVKQPDKKEGNIYDFRSIRFMRMFMQNFRKDIVLRFATLELVRSDWRRYEGDLTDNAISSDAEIEVSAVNIEEDGNRQPVNYILPPKIDRIIDQNNPQLRQLNEQSMMLKVEGLNPGEARGAYKEILLDMRQFKHLDMEVHAEEIEDSSTPLKDDELTVFLRMGSDYNNNYYEYEVPLKVTEPGFYYDNSLIDKETVWPTLNRISIDLDILPKHKQDRNAAMRRQNSDVYLNTVYQKVHAGVNDNKNRITIKGNPNLAEVEVLMIGVRNPSKDLEDKGAIVWVNELRLSEFDEKGGWAASGRFSSKLADLGNVSFTGRKSTSGFGAIDQNITQRSLENQSAFDVATNLQLGKFFGEKSGVKIPMYVGYSEDISTPEYNPLDPDIKLDDALSAAPDRATRDSIKSFSQDKTTRKSINFTNVKIDKKKKRGSKPKVYDISNFSVTYSYNEVNHKDANTLFDVQKNHRALFNYNYSARPKPIEPFKKMKALKSPHLRLIKDFNFYLLPKQLSFRSDMNRMYNEVKTRNITGGDIPEIETYEKDFIWSRYYDFKYDLSRNLQFDFSATNRARIDEPEGRFHKDEDDYKAKRDSIIENILELGRTTGYNHTFNATYKVPLNKLPLLNWTTLTGKYQSGYNWLGGPKIADEQYNLGNTINNTNILTINGQANLVNLYNKNKWLKGINSKFRSGSSSRKKPVKTEEVKYEDSKVSFKKNSPKSIFHRLGTETVEIVVKTQDGKEIEGEVNVINPNRLTFKTDQNIENALVEVTGKVKPKENPLKVAAEITSGLLMSIRNVSISYSDRNGTTLPGFLPSPKYLGNRKFSPEAGMPSSFAPGWGFVFGQQDMNFGMKAAENGWLTSDSVLNAPNLLTSTEKIDLRMTLEPWPNIKVDLTGTHSKTRNFSQFITNTGNKWEALNKSWNGNFSMSIMTISTAFEKMGETGVDESEAFAKFKENRLVIANRLATQREIVSSTYERSPQGHTSNFPNGYGINSPDVLIPAFLAAYTGQDASSASLDPMPSLKHMRPNWRLTYRGAVDKIPGMKKLMKSLSLSHAYRSTYNVGSYQSNLTYKVGDDGLSTVRDQLENQGNFLPQYQINSVSINEQFSPLFNLDMTWLNNMTTRFEIRRSRNLSLSLSNNQLAEVRSNEFSFDFGYRFEKMYLFFKTNNSEKAISNDLNLRAGLSIRKNKNALRRLDVDESQITSGQKTVTLKMTADYQLSKDFTIRMFYDRNLNNPYVSNSFPTMNSNFGVSLKFTLMN